MELGRGRRVTLSLFARLAIRSFASALGIHSTALFKMKNIEDDAEAVIIPSTIVFHHPAPTPHHQYIYIYIYRQQLQTCSSIIMMHLHQPVHDVDEVQFDIPEAHGLVNCPLEGPSDFLCQNKDCSIIKALSLCALPSQHTLPPNGEHLFGGKIGMFPFIEACCPAEIKCPSERGFDNHISK